MKQVTRRTSLGLFLASALAAGSVKPSTRRGKLSVNANGRPVLLLSDGQTLLLEGDPSTEAVLRDERLHGSDLEVAGSFAAPGRFRINPIHTKAMHIWRNNQRLQISYWCEVCSIRTYVPGKCMCCQEETAVDLKESFDP